MAANMAPNVAPGTFTATAHLLWGSTFCGGGRAAARAAPLKGFLLYKWPRTLFGACDAFKTG